MRRFLLILFFVFALGLAALFTAGFMVIQHINAPNDVTETHEMIITPGTSGRAIAHNLAEQKLIQYPDLFYGLLRLKNVSVKAGEYAVPPHSSMQDILNLFHDGKTIQRQITLAEGLTVKQAVNVLNANPYLEGTIETLPQEGSLLPETYSFIRGETRQALIERMQKAQQDLLERLWESRDASLPLASKKEVVILASIIEKETGKPEERERIAGLFFNRLKIGMPLQTDPTVVYAITDGLGHMQGKPLLRKHLQVDSPYNTYRNVGLPPGPIANPGRASLESVFKPEQNDYLFFVADGTGGHVFGRTLAEHNRNVVEWRKIKKELQKKK